MKTFAPRVVAFLAFMFMAPLAFAQNVIPLYPADAPGSAHQADQEKQFLSKAWNTEVVTNVSRPTLTLFKPTGGVNSGSAVIICPGGGFMALSIENEGNQPAKYLAARGITVFVLRYRLMATGTDATEEFSQLLRTNRAQFEQMVAKAVPIAIEDGMAAVAYVRQHAAEYGVSPDKVGLMGFSAGGGVATGVAFHYKPESRPAFLGMIYSGGEEFSDAKVPADAPPMFIAAASDDPLSLPTVNIALYQKWSAARAPVEIHMYARGGHGFGMRAQNIPTDHWIDRYTDWLELQGFLKK
jgi:acetyl esterase/lipase